MVSLTNIKAKVQFLFYCMAGQYKAIKSSPVVISNEKKCYFYILATVFLHKYPVVITIVIENERSIEACFLSAAKFLAVVAHAPLEQNDPWLIDFSGKRIDITTSISVKYLVIIISALPLTKMKTKK